MTAVISTLIAINFSLLLVSVQVLNEYYVNAYRKNVTPAEIQNTVRQFILDFDVVPLTKELTLETFRIHNRYQFSYWDSNIISAALKGACDVFYTEDLQDGQIIDDRLKVINPMLKS
ncbi:hypothetical protein AGMMS49546_03230 [Spirochaetia bacterium]|nr:hypothetical protein AGMMS49546_03230 [Spirochaetia bacterium]